MTVGKIRRTALSALALACVMATSASAATFDVSGSFAGGLLGAVTFDLTITGDFSGNIVDMAVASGSISSSVVPLLTPASFGGLGFSYISSSDALLLGGLGDGIGNITNATTDFTFLLTGFSSNPTAVFAVDSIAGSPSTSGSLTNLSVSVTENAVSQVPLPASALLLLGGLGALFFTKRSLT